MYAQKLLYVCKLMTCSLTTKAFVRCVRTINKTSELLAIVSVIVQSRCWGGELIQSLGVLNEL